MSDRVNRPSHTSADPSSRADKRSCAWTTLRLGLLTTTVFIMTKSSVEWRQILIFYTCFFCADMIFIPFQVFGEPLKKLLVGWSTRSFVRSFVLSQLNQGSFTKRCVHMVHTPGRALVGERRL